MIHMCENIRYYRNLLGMTQKDLAEGICDVSTLYRIEKGLQIPRLELLTEICSRLKVPMDYIVSNITHIGLSEIDKYKRLCREFTYSKDYQSLKIIIEEFKEFISKYKNQPEFSHLNRYIKWHQAIYIHESDNNLEEAERVIKSIYSTKLRTELDIGICNSLGLITLDIHGVDPATSFFLRAYNALHNIPFHTDNTLLPRVGYNLAYCYYYKQEIDKTITIAYKVLEQLEANQLSFMLGKTKHMIGKIHQIQEDYEQAIEFIRQASYLFYIEGKEIYYNQAQKDLEELNSLIRKSSTKLC